MSPGQATPPPSRRPLILIVDDMPDIRDMYAEYLAGQGFRPELATDGFEALSKATVMGPDVIVMDLNLPRARRLGGHPAPEGERPHPLHPRHRAHRPVRPAFEGRGPGGRAATGS